jgi:hypothetical protein
VAKSLGGPPSPQPVAESTAAQHAFEFEALKLQIRSDLTFLSLLDAIDPPLAGDQG